MKSSIHIRPVSIGSEGHNQRKRELNYVRADLSPNNSSFVLDSIANTKASIEQRYKESTGQKMQVKATPIREGVLLVGENHTSLDLIKLANKLEKEFGIKAFQGYVHKDEGHWNKETGEWKSNYHAHMVFDWTDEKGKSIKLGREDMARMQTIVAEELGLERGQSSTKKHIESRAFKVEKLEEEIKNQERKLGVVKDLDIAVDKIKNFEIRQLGGLLVDKTATIERLKSYAISSIAKSDEKISKAVAEAEKKASEAKRELDRSKHPIELAKSLLERNLRPLIEKEGELSKKEMLQAKLYVTQAFQKVDIDSLDYYQRLKELKASIQQEEKKEKGENKSKDWQWGMGR
jgi:hypothetical protein